MHLVVEMAVKRAYPQVAAMAAMRVGRWAVLMAVATDFYLVGTMVAEWAIW